MLLISSGATEGLLKEKRHGNFTKDVLFFHNNAPAHRALAAQKKLNCLCFQCLDHSLYSPHLAPSDYHLFPGLKKQLEVCHFSSRSQFITVAETWLHGKHTGFFF
jgi:histone-lysine N-methyltransferase SETMAR